MKSTNKHFFGCIALIIVFSVSLVPLLIVSRFNRPLPDDYHNGAITRADIDESGIRAMPSALFNAIRDRYLHYSGSIIGAALISINPGVILGENAYPIVTVITLLTFILSTLMFTAQISSIFAYSRWVAIGALVLLLSIQWAPVAPIAFFSWSGSESALVFYSCMLASTALKLRMFSELIRWRRIAAILLLDFIVGGGNIYVAIWLVVINLGFLVVNLIYQRKETWHAVFYGFFSALAIAALLITLTAPGNRYNLVVAPFSLRIITEVLTESAGDIIAWTNPPLILTVIIIAALLRNSLRQARFKFKAPVLAPIIGYLTFNLAYLPSRLIETPANSQHSRNVLYFLYVWLVMFSACYIYGWYAGRSDRAKQIEKYAFYSIALVCISIICFSSIRDSTAFVALTDISEGTAQVFLDEYNARLEILNSDEPTAALARFSVRPRSFYSWDIENTTDAYTNRALSRYYRKEAVIVG